MTAATVMERPAKQAPRKRAPRKPALVDRTTLFAQQVLAGSIVAGPHVRDACARHLRDLRDGPARGLTWSVEHAAEDIAFFEEVLCLNGGQYEGRPFVLDGWQAFIVGSLGGWRKGDVRRYRVAYVETGKGSGKSPLAAGIGLKGLTAEGEARAEIYAAATKKDQAMILFRDAVAMFQQSKELRERLTPSGTGENVWNLGYRATGSWFRPISADDGQSGPRPHIGLIDEVHEHKTGYVVDMMQAGFKSRRQPLVFMITNSGAGKNTPCGIYHDYACEVAAGRRKDGQECIDDTYFSFVCSLDEGDDPFTDETCWLKANPGLQHNNLPGLDYLRQQVREARGMPAKEAIVRRLNFCEWTASISPWLSAAVWDPCQASFTERQLHGRRAYAGLDLSSTTDLTAFVLLVEPVNPGEPWHMLPYCWLPDEGLGDRCQRDRVDYLTWKRDGHLETSPGRAISKRHVLQRVAQICSNFDVQNIAADRWRLEDFVQIASDEGITIPQLIPFGQGFKDMSPAIEQFETAILNRTVAHNGHPVLTWCAANAVTDSDPAGNRKLNKIKATGRIDLVVAAVMAHASSASNVEGLAALDDFINNPVMG